MRLAESCIAVNLLMTKDEGRRTKVYCSSFVLRRASTSYCALWSAERGRSFCPLSLMGGSSFPAFRSPTNSSYACQRARWNEGQSCQFALLSIFYVANYPNERIARWLQR